MTLHEKLDNAPRPLVALGVVVLVSALCIAAYSNSFSASFHLDDHHQITENPGIRDISNIPRIFTDTGYSSSLRESGTYRPLTTASFALSYAMGGTYVRGYHVFNIILHILNAFIVFLVVREVVGRVSGGAGLSVPLFISLVFALHPIQTGAVTYISGRAVLLATFFSLLSFYSFVRFRGSGGARAAMWGTAAPVLFMVGLLCKEMAISILLVAITYDLVFPVLPGRSRPRTLAYHLSFLAAGFLVYEIRSVMIIKVDMMVSVGDYLLSEAKVLLMYVKLLLLPVGLNADHFFPVTHSFDPAVGLSAAFIAASLFALYRMKDRMPAEAFFGLWFFAAIMPESSFFPITDLAVEYRLYLPSVGFISMCVLLGARLLRPGHVRLAVCLAVILALGLLTFNRNRVYATEYTFWSDVAKKSPHSARAALYLGIELADAKRYDEAERVLKRGLDMDNRAAAGNLVCNAYDRLGEIYFETGRYNEAAGVFGRQVEEFGDLPQPEYNLALTLMMLDENEAAVGHMERALGIAGNSFDIRYNLALLYERTGRYSEALHSASYALGLASGDIERSEVDVLLRRLEAHGAVGGRAD